MLRVLLPGRSGTAELRDAARSIRRSVPLFDLSGICLKGAGRDRLNGVTLQIHAGVTAVVGYSGAGKTSLLNLLAGFETADSGTLKADLRVAEGSEALPLFWAPQGGGLWPHLTVEQHLSQVCGGRSQPAGIRAEREARRGRKDSDNCEESQFSADEILSRLDLQHRKQAYPETLSQGECSRLAVARALASHAAVLILDEPLAHVDSSRKPEYWQLIRDMIQATSISMIFASHDADAVIREADNLICLHNGQLVFHGATQQLYHHPPGQQTGEFLGRMNWFSADDWILQGIRSSCGQPAVNVSPGIRPEWLELYADPDSGFVVQSTVFSGCLSETTVMDVGRKLHRTVLHVSGSDLPVGQRVSLRFTAAHDRTVRTDDDGPNCEESRSVYKETIQLGDAGQSGNSGAAFATGENSLQELPGK